MELGKLLKSLKKELPKKTYLVGGTVRDLFLNREPADMDLLVEGDPKKTAERLAKKLGGTFFGFKKENLPVRGEVYTVFVPFEGKKYRIDLSEVKDLEEDLRERDFTVNAMALPLEEALKDSPKPIDPFGGLDDLKRRLIRAVAFENLLKDPLRMLRAYRIAHTLGFEIEPATREFIKKHFKELSKVAKERVLTELLKGSVSPNAHRFFEMLLEDILQKVPFGEIPPEVLKKGTGLLKEVERKEGLYREIKSDRTYLGEFDQNLPLRWSALLFYADPKRLKNFLKLYPFGEDLSNCILGTVEGVKELENLDLSKVEEVYRHLKRFKDCLYPISVLGEALGLSRKVEWLVDFYRNRFLRFSKPLLDGREVMKLLNLRPSPTVGRLLENLVLAQLEGKVSSRREAENYILKLFEEWQKKRESTNSS